MTGSIYIKDFIKHTISINKEVIDRTAIKDCHCIGLNSFIINEKPKMRLFIAEQHCELYKRFIKRNPIIPIHAHKYDDLFFQLEGLLIHYLYEVKPKYEPFYSIEFNKYTYNRISDNNEIKNLGKVKLIFQQASDKVDKLKANQLHTASLMPINNRCSWVIMETKEDKDFEQVAYHQNLVHRPELYGKFENAYDYLTDYFTITQ